MALLTCRDVVLGYDGRPVVSGLSFSVSAGDYLCIVGENGSGKSTLIKALLRLHHPLSGSIETGDGLEFCSIGYLPQQTLVQKDFPASVEEIVLSGCLNRMGRRPFYSRNERRLAAENMAKLGIVALSKRCYRELSGGQQQRVLLARALCATRQMLLLDEPVAGLDPQAAQEMYEQVAKLNQDDGVTVLMVTHDIAMAARYASHILHIAQRPLFFGPAAEYLRSDIGQAYLSVTGGADHV